MTAKKKAAGDDSVWMRPVEKVDPYDDPAAVSKPVKKRRAKRAGVDPYDDPSIAVAPPAKKPRASKVTRRTPEQTGKDDFIADIDDNRKPQAKQNRGDDKSDIGGKERKHKANDGFIADIDDYRKSQSRSKSKQSDNGEHRKVQSIENVRKPQSAKKTVDGAEKRQTAKKTVDSGKSPAMRKNDGGSVGGGKRKRRGGWATFVLIALIAVCLMAGAGQLIRYGRFKDMRNALNRGTFFAGTRIDGVDVSGMDESAALEHWEHNVEPGYSGMVVSIGTDVSVTAEQLGYESDYRTAIERVWREQHEGNLGERYEKLRAVSGANPNYAINRVYYDEARVDKLVSKMAERVNAPMTEASVSGFNSDDYSFTFTEGSAGYVLDTQRLKSDIIAVLNAGGGDVQASISEQLPTVSTADIKAMYGMRSSATTNASSSSSNRLSNISKAIGSINGVKLEPGEEFSFNGTVGQRTAKRGYKMAGAFSGGEVIEELGGGICQVSTTLFNAAVKADLKITERHAHSMPVSYVDKGKDATVSWGSQDFKFKNNTNAPIYIAAKLTKEKRVKIGIFGLMIPDGIYITVEAKVDSTEDFETVYQENGFLAPGVKNVLQEGRKGYKATAYKMYWDKDGKLLNKEVLCKSVYPKRNTIIEIPAW